jgi:hypothetical protein
MKVTLEHRGYKVLETGCCGNTLYAIARPNGIIFERNLVTPEEAVEIIDAIEDSKSNTD